MADCDDDEVYPTTYTLMMQPYYNTYTKCYQNIVTINMIPEGPLKKHVRQIKFNRLSPFDESCCTQSPACGLVLVDFLPYAKNTCNGCQNYMSPDSIPNLFSYLTANRYKIDTSLTKMMNTSEISLSDRRIIAFITHICKKPSHA